MEALKLKYEQNKDEVLSRLDVNSDLLDVMTRHSLIDISDWVKFKNVADARERGASVMKTLVQRSTDHAYPLFIQCLREVGQDTVADLLTDIGEETRILIQLQCQLEKEIHSISDYIQQEEHRTGLVGQTGSGASGPEPSAKPASVPVTDRQVWDSVQATLKRATVHLGRCRVVIEKLHSDRQELARARDDMNQQVRNSYNKVQLLLRSSHVSPGAFPTSTQAMFQTMMADVETLMTLKTRSQDHDHEGRASSMRILRHLRDWIEERSLFLDKLCSSTGGGTARHGSVSNPHPRRGVTNTSVNGGSDNTPTPRSGFYPSPSPPRSHSQDSFDEGSGDLTPPELPQVSEPRERVEPHAIRSVLQGLRLLEQQMRNYVQMEIQLTARYRTELRIRRHRRTAQGYTPRGFSDALRMLDDLDRSLSAFPARVRGSISDKSPCGKEEGKESPGEEKDARNCLAKLRSCLDAMQEEYDACAKFMERVTDVDAFLGETEEVKETKQKKNKKKDEHKDERKNDRGKEWEEKPRFSLFGKKKEANIGSHQQQLNSPNKTAPPVGDRGFGLPAIDASTNRRLGDNTWSAKGEETLLASLKQLVTRHDKVKHKVREAEDRFRREYEYKRRAFDTTLREKGEEMARLQIRLKETEAEKEKYRSLYDNMKIGFVKRR